MGTCRLVVIAGVISALVGCSMMVSPDELSSGDSLLSEGSVEGTDAGRPTRNSVSSDAGSGEDSSSAPSSDETTQQDSGGMDPGTGTGTESDAGGTNPCEGKPDGFAYMSGSPADRCCGGQPSKINTTNNCGGCGIQCPSTFGCGQVTTGKWGCHCSTDAQCETAGYGTGATCYTDSTGSFCNCQCPGGAVSCKNLCRGGGTCTDDLGQNYCGYP